MSVATKKPVKKTPKHTGAGLKPVKAPKAAANGKAAKTKTGKKAAVKKAVRKREEGEELPEAVHLTDRYKAAGRGKGSEATRTTEKRRAIEDFVKDGATLGEVEEKFGRTGLRNVAKHTRFGKYEIEGVSADAKPRLDAAADKKLADKFAKMDGDTKIKVLKSPVQLAR